MSLDLHDAAYTIHKYKLAITDEQIVSMPRGALVLAVQEQHGELCFWAQVNTAEPLQARTFRVIGTGHPIPDAKHLNHMATVLMHDGKLVWHVFESYEIIEAE